MHGNDEFIYVHMPKTGGTTIRNILEENYGAVHLNNHDPARSLVGENIKNKKIVGSVRNPFKWYVSCYQYFKKTHPNLFKVGDSFSDFMEYNMFEAFDRIGPTYPSPAKDYNIGFYTSTFLEFFCKKDWRSEITRKSRDEFNKTRKWFDFDEVMNECLIIDDFIKLENIKNDLNETLSDIYGEKHNFIENIPTTKKGDYFKNYKEFYNEYLKKLVYYKDKFILNEFDYSF